MADLTTRSATANDFNFCWKLYSHFVKDPLTPHIQGGWIASNEEAKFKSIWSTDEAHIIEYDGSPVGWLSYHETENSLNVDQFYLESKFHHRKIGTIIFNYISDQARLQGKRRVAAEVLKGATAKDFFVKIGFVEYGSTSLCTQLEKAT
ncbi:Acetyltransferase (GNAT) family [Burkholderia pseudomallei]|uniref:GNAT family N-acetyltransferase n=1 Tax=Burkholderia pseudomallei TaxID=28450 RepID=UPI000F13E879|nr:GNAT family N-acetyltransferase [Burkholderia pseudomallei]CAJ2754560.1 Acetyltransferase (GNAT) family [Burkholderia pseudomallei]VCJ93077.1 Acetyltransferase (GNAT) family [Burkholderia pseudomallei]VCJ95179.1 Acetyltransferase (GNAT) family [Burkholderia pseudomallei]VCJ95512.1 Acetyltransferase (GNAT) family [Burkholderia pseudomallei]VCJ97815.1 Acetyltransferase (GNAT) family [Burkholderia pseudomallei]